MERVKIDFYISDLLYQYDCVVVPDFGGFVANFSAAKIQEAQHKFLPPSKSLSFNKNLRVNDGLLANHIAGRKSISYQEALNLIKDFVQTSEEGLNSGNKVVIEKVGTLYTDSEKNICFSPDSSVNYLQDSFGLESFKKSPINKKTIEREIREGIKNLPALEVGKTKKSISWKAAAAIFLGLLGGSWLTFNYQSNSNPYVSYSNLSFFSTVPSKYTPVAKEIIEENENVEGNYWVERNDSFSELVLVKKLAEENSIIVSKIEDSHKATAMDNTMVEDKTASKRLIYHVVGGCFSVYKNAESLYTELNKKGFNARMIGKHNNLHAVSYSSFSTRQEALAFLSKIKNDENPNAWLLVK